MMIITNNPLAKQQLSDIIDVELLDCSYIELLTEIRDRVHKGVKILTHPLSGSVKPNETPFKSVIITKQQKDKIDMDSLILIENSIITAKKFAPKYINMTDRIKDDFAVVDATLIRNAVNSAIQ
ncbi:MAG: GrdX family protein [Oscillospiraceae bacterium]